MLRKCLLLAMLALPAGLWAQASNPLWIWSPSAPSGSCSSPTISYVVYPAGTLYTCQNGTWAQVSGGGGGSGTVTSVSVATANGFQGTVANATTTPAANDAVLEVAGVRD